MPCLSKSMVVKRMLSAHFKTSELSVSHLRALPWQSKSDDTQVRRKTPSTFKTTQWRRLTARRIQLVRSAKNHDRDQRAVLTHQLWARLRKTALLTLRADCRRQWSFARSTKKPWRRLSLNLSSSNNLGLLMRETICLCFRLHRYVLPSQVSARTPIRDREQIVWARARQKVSLPRTSLSFLRVLLSAMNKRTPLSNHWT